MFFFKRQVVQMIIKINIVDDDDMVILMLTTEFVVVVDCDDVNLVHNNCTMLGSDESSIRIIVLSVTVNNLVFSIFGARRISNSHFFGFFSILF